jgi:hypothetical protein
MMTHDEWTAREEELDAAYKEAIDAVDRCIPSHIGGAMHHVRWIHFLIQEHCNTPFILDGEPVDPAGHAIETAIAAIKSRTTDRIATNPQPPEEP